MSVIKAGFSTPSVTANRALMPVSTMTALRATTCKKCTSNYYIIYTVLQILNLLNYYEFGCTLRAIYTVPCILLCDDCNYLVFTTFVISKVLNGRLIYKLVCTVFCK